LSLSKKDGLQRISAKRRHTCRLFDIKGKESKKKEKLSGKKHGQAEKEVEKKGKREKEEAKRTHMSLCIYSREDFSEARRLLGHGSYGEVLESTEIRTGEVVALKRVFLRFVSPTYFPISAFREIQAHSCLNHPNIVSCWGVFSEPHTVTLVMEACLCDLNTLMEHSLGLAEDKARGVLRDILLGLSNCHEMGLIHRDIKSSNILVRENGEVCLGDFGLARPYRRGCLAGSSGGWEGKDAQLTAQVTSRWYRSPEILFGSGVYGPPIDMWAVGVLAVELLTGKPWAAGGSDLEQLSIIVAQLGSPEKTWPDVVNMPDYSKVSFTPCPPADLSVALGGSPSIEILSFISALLKWDPAARLTAEAALKHPFFDPSLPISSIAGLCAEIKSSSAARTSLPKSISFESITCQPPE